MKCGSLVVMTICAVGSTLLAGQNSASPAQERSISTENAINVRSQSSPEGKRGPIDILTDTGGVDFRSFLRESIHRVKTNWYKVIPEAAKPPIERRGAVTISFRVMEDGTIANAQIYEKSDDDSLNEAARQAVIASNPLPALPADFACKYADLRFHFYYNPDITDPTTENASQVLPCVTSTVRIGGSAGLEVSPASVQVATRGKQRFVTRTAVYSSEAVTWSIAGPGCTGSACGMITAEELYTAPENVPQPPTVTVTAILRTTPPETASGTLTIVRSITPH